MKSFEHGRGPSIIPHDDANIYSYFFYTCAHLLLIHVGGEFPKNIPGMPDMGDMNPEEMQAVARQAQIQVSHVL